MRRGLLGALALTASLSPSIARAAPPVDGDDGPLTMDATSPDGALGKSAFDAGRWLEAAPHLHRVARGQTPDGAIARELADYRLAVALHELGLHRASLAGFAAIADREAHTAHVGAMRWLARLGRELPEPAGFAAPISRYTASEIAALRAAWPEDHATLAYWSGRELARRRTPVAREEAADRLLGVAPGTREYLPAQLLAGILVATSSRAFNDAMRAFLRVIDAVDREPDPAPERVRLRDLALISAARASFTAALRSLESGGYIHAGRFSAALRYWDRIEPASEQYRAVFLERPRARYFSGDDGRLLGELYTYRSPFFPPSPTFEADQLEGFVYLLHCRYDDAATMAARVQVGGAARRRELEGALAQLAAEAGEARLWALIEAERAGASTPARAAFPAMDVLRASRPLLRHVDYARALDAERARLDALPVAFRGSPLGDEVRELLRIERASAPGAAAAMARARYLDAIADVDRSVLEAKQLSLAVRAASEAAPIGPSTPLAWEFNERIPSDDEHVSWPFDGEHWRDELGSFRVVPRGGCPR